MSRTCKIENCKDQIKARGMCSKHYARWLRHGDANVTFKKRHEKKCRVKKGCSKTYASRGYCHRHYNLFKKYGTPTPDIPVERKCDIFWCNYVHWARGLCRKHLYIWEKYLKDVDVVEYIAYEEMEPREQRAYLSKRNRRDAIWKASNKVSNLVKE